MTSLVSGFAEVTLETPDLGAMERFYREVVGLRVLSREDDRVWLAVGERARLGLWVRGEKEFGDRSVYFRDPSGNVVDAWDFFGRGRDVDALT